MTRKNHVPAVTREAGLAARAIMRLEAAAEAVHGKDGGERYLHAVSSKDGFSALLRAGKTVIEIQGDSFAVRQMD